jgi:uncharacterized protein YggE
MPDVEITVRGTATTTHPPEFATVYLAASAQGSERAEVHERADVAAKAIIDAITPLVDADNGPITHWWSEQLRVETHREYQGHKDHEVLVHSADVSFRVRFGGSDAGTGGFARLGAWLGTVIAVDDVEVRHTGWELSDSTRERLTEQVRSEAVRNAQQRAVGYARDLGLTNVRPVAAADPGLLGRSVEHGGAVPLAGGAARLPSSSRSMNVNFAPEDIEIRAAVDMRFLAG